MQELSKLGYFSLQGQIQKFWKREVLVWYQQASVTPAYPFPPTRQVKYNIEV